MVILLFSSCKKCKECFVEETNTLTGIVSTFSLGEKCGKDWKKIDGRTYQGYEGPAKSYCK